ncbi:tyrosine-type recombinase/integrase [Candidatus Bathyarchaeota archaeon]|nr:tyrosine-type recombinase/integrase [Candidatus Bathyarchaeota archaeon]
MELGILKVEKKGDEVTNWLNRLGSDRSREHYKKDLMRFLKEYEIDLDELLDEWKKVKYDLKKRMIFEDKLSEIIQDYYDRLDAYAPFSRWKLVTPLLSFFRKHLRMNIDINIERFLYVKYNNRELRKEEIRKILEHADLRDRCFFLMMLESGLRPATLVQLRYKHIKEDFEKGRVPMKIDLPSELLKDRVSARWSFIGEHGYRVLREYLWPRLPLKDDDFIFEHKKPSRGKLNPRMFSQAFGRIAEKLGMVEHQGRGKPRPIRLYCLRKYFRNNMKVDSSYVRFWMGHSLGTDAHYISRDVELHRKLYQEGYPFLSLMGEEERKKDEELERLRKRVKELEEYQRSLEMLAELINTPEKLKKLKELLEEP